MFKINKYCRGDVVSAVVGLYPCGKLFIIIAQESSVSLQGKFEPECKSTESLLINNGLGMWVLQ